MNILCTATQQFTGEKLCLYVDNDHYIMDGGKYGKHSLLIADTTNERLIAHWHGYLTAAHDGLSGAVISGPIKFIK